MKFNKAATKLKFREFAIDSNVENIDGDDAVKFRIFVKSMRSPMGDYKCLNL